MDSKKRIKNVKRILILIVILFLLYLTSKAQVVLSINNTGDSTVCMPVPDYRKIRNIVLQTDTLETECDSIINTLETKIAIKDTLLKNSISKIAIRDSTIIQKVNTINGINKEYEELEEDYNKEKSSILSNFKFWFGGALGLFFGILIDN